VKVETIMTQPAWTCGPGTNLASVVETMWTHDCGIVPVVNERGEAVGLVTDRDICIALGTRNATAAMLTAADVMSQPVAGCAPEDDCFVALMTMQERGVHRLPVLGTGDVVAAWPLEIAIRERSVPTTRRPFSAQTRDRSSGAAGCASLRSRLRL
jgi:CBS domain-containing protein